VRLELAFLDEGRAVPASPPPTIGERSGPTLLVVAAEADLRRYVRECLRERADLRVVDAATVNDAVAIAGQLRPELLVVDEPERDVLVMLPHLGAILLVDDVPRETPGADRRVRLLARPFSADALVSAVARLSG
jgi:DNA-binding NarL/FixJ family response regulator